MSAERRDPLALDLRRRPPRRAPLPARTVPTTGTPPVLTPRALERGTPRPFVKWVGGKTQLLPELLANAPEQFRAYHEPFMGGAALFFALVRQERLGRRRAFLSDVNRELVDTYVAIRDEVESVISALEQHAYEREHYYRVRALDPWSMGPSERAARLLYLNRTGFNGLYRVNRQGEFNVPFGRYTSPRICDAENLRAVSRALSGVAIEHRPFHGVVERAQPGDLVYFDPPYVPLSPTASFVSYAQGGFALEDQERLAGVFDALAERGVRVMLSNSDTSWVRDRYGRHRVHSVLARRNVNSKASARGPVGEVLVVG